MKLLNLVYIFAGLFIAYSIFVFFYNKKTNRWNSKKRRFERYEAKYENEFTEEKNTTSLIKRGLFELIYIQRNLSNQNNPIAKKYWTKKDVADYLDEGINYHFTQTSISIVSDHNKTKKMYIPLVKNKSIEGRDFTNEDWNSESERMAYSYFEDAAGLGVPENMTPDRLTFILLGYCKLQGLGTDKSEKKAKEFFDKAGYSFESTAGGYKLDVNE